MFTESLNQLFERDLNLLAREISSFHNEEHLWKVRDGISNSAGNLTLHLCGNLKHFIGAILGNTGYVRQREAEFSSKNIPVEELIRNVEGTRDVVLSVLRTLQPADLEKTYPVSLWDKTFSTAYFLIHLHSHLNYHLGQINYLRRLLEPV